MKNNYYEVLDISPTATQEEVKKAYRNKIKEYHPDNNSDPMAVNVMTLVNIAYETLSDITLRRRYDTKLYEQAGFKYDSTQNYKRNCSYSSYTKTREESESDFENWLKNYLRKERNKFNATNDKKESYIKYDIKLLELLKKTLSKEILFNTNRKYIELNSSKQKRYNTK